MTSPTHGIPRRDALAGMAGAAALAAIGGRAFAQAQPKEITIGALCSLTGAAAVFGASARNAFEVRVDEVNKAGGLWGNGNGMIKLAVTDDQSKPEIAVSELARFARERSITAVVSLVSSAAMLQATIEAERQRIVLVNAGSVARDINERGLKYTFTTGSNTDGIVRSYLEFTRELIKNGPAPKKVALVFENKLAGPAYRKAWAELYGSTVGWGPAAEYPYDPATTDFAPLVSKLKADGIDFPVLSGYPQDTILLVRAMREQRYDPLAISGFFGALPSIEVVTALGKDAEYIMGQSPYLHDLKVAGAADFVASFQKKVGKLPDPLAGLSYTAISGLLAALKRASNAADREAVREAMSRLDVPVGQENVVIPAGIRIDAKGANPISQGGYFQIRGGVHRAIMPSSFATIAPVYPRPSWDKYAA